MKNSRQSKAAKVEGISFLQGWDGSKFPSPKCKTLNTCPLIGFSQLQIMHAGRHTCAHTQAVCAFVKIMITKEVTKFEGSWGGHRRIWNWRGNYTKKGCMRPLSQPPASDSQKEPDEQFPIPNFLAELQSHSIWPRSLISLFFGDVSFWPSSHGQNLGQFLDECAWIFLILSVLTRSVVPFPHVVFSALFLPCLALSRRLASMLVLRDFFAIRLLVRRCHLVGRGRLRIPFPAIAENCSCWQPGSP